MIVSYLRIAGIVVYTGVLATLAILVGILFHGGRLYHAIGRAFGRGVLVISGVKLRVEGLERVSFTRSYIYAANHASLFDIPAAFAGIPDRVHFIYKRELERIPIFGWSLKFGKTYIAIDRGSATDAMRSIERAADKIRSGASVILFPEGTRSSSGKLQEFKRGAFSLAVKSGVPVVPLTINGSFRVMPRETFRIRPGTITLVFGSPIDVGKLDGKSAEIRLREEVRSQIAQHFVEQG
jgi:1-acyl-sn-glycerol-3-phosphate acyltransferase